MRLFTGGTGTKGSVNVNSPGSSHLMNCSAVLWLEG
jgi:hypothetical protein